MDRYKNIIASVRKISNLLTIAVMSGALSVVASNTAYAICANATPQGGSVVAGSATISTPSTGNEVIDQSSERAVINWNSFNVGGNASVQFNQPDAQALTVNRVTGSSTNPAQILGAMKSNGQIMILDQNGVLFGSNAVINVGGIIASTGNVDNNQVMSGASSINITGIGSGSVINNGQITAAQGGLVALVAPYVANSGVITANMGRVELAAGSAVTVDLYGDNLVSLAVNGPVANALVENSGTITANGGRVALTASAAQGVVNNVINMTGIVQANSVGEQNGEIVLDGGDAGTVAVSGQINATGAASGQTGGRVDITGNQIALNDAQINVSGANGGGQVYVGAGPNGTQDGDASPAAITTVSADTVIDADATGNGNGGAVVIWGSQQDDYYGTTTARGGANGGNGGQVEVSTGAGVNFDGMVNTTAANGTVGTLLIDPTDVTIGNSRTQPNGTYLNAQQIADDLVVTSIIVQATGAITIADNSNLSTSAQGTPQYDLSLITPTLNVNNNLNMAAAGNLYLTATTINLNGEFTSGGTTIDPSRVIGTATQVNVLSNAASIQQGMDIASAASPVTVQVSAGSYNENLTINKDGLTLSGLTDTGATGADPAAPQISGTIAGGNIITVAANNVTIDGLILNAQVGDGSVANSANGIYANAVDSLTISQNTFNGWLTTSGISAPSSTNVTYNANQYSTQYVAAAQTAQATAQTDAAAAATANANDATATAADVTADAAATAAAQTASADAATAVTAQSAATTANAASQTDATAATQAATADTAAQSANAAAQAAATAAAQTASTDAAQAAAAAAAQAAASATAQTDATAASQAVANATALAAAATAAQAATVNAYNNAKAADLAAIKSTEQAAIDAANQAKAAADAQAEAAEKAALADEKTMKAEADAAANTAQTAADVAAKAALVAAEKGATAAQKAAAVADEKIAVADAAAADQIAKTAAAAEAKDAEAITRAEAKDARIDAREDAAEAKADAVAAAKTAKENVDAVAQAAANAADAAAAAAEAAATQAAQVAAADATAATQAAANATAATAAATAAQNAANAAAATSTADAAQAGTTATAQAAADAAAQAAQATATQAAASAATADAAATSAQAASNTAAQASATAASQAASADAAKSAADAAAQAADAAAAAAEAAAAAYNQGT